MAHWMQCDFIQTYPVWADSSCPLGVGGQGSANGRRKPAKREVIVRMSEVQNRADTAEFLKQQLRLRHPQSAFEDTSAQDERAKQLADQARREKAMRDKAAREALESAAEAERISIQNENMRILLMLASAV